MIRYFEHPILKYGELKVINNLFPTLQCGGAEETPEGNNVHYFGRS